VCGSDWLLVESRPGDDERPRVSQLDVEAFILLRTELHDVGVRLVDAIVFDDSGHWWSMREMADGTTSADGVNSVTERASPIVWRGSSSSTRGAEIAAGARGSVVTEDLGYPLARSAQLAERLETQPLSVCLSSERTAMVTQRVTASCASQRSRRGAEWTAPKPRDPCRE
jgi:hypothetical protein